MFFNLQAALERYEQMKAAEMRERAGAAGLRKVM